MAFGQQGKDQTNARQFRLIYFADWSGADLRIFKLLAQPKRDFFGRQDHINHVCRDCIARHPIKLRRVERLDNRGPPSLVNGLDTLGSIATGTRQDHCNRSGTEATSE